MRKRGVSEGLRGGVDGVIGKAIGTSVADTTSNGGRALDFPATPIASGNSRLMETVCKCVCVSVCVPLLRQGL